MNSPTIIKQCVMIGESLDSDYASASIFSKIGLIPVIDQTFAWLQEHGINQIFFFYAKSKDAVEAIHQKTWSKMNEFRVHLMYMKPQQMKNFGDVMREVQFRNIISQDFLVMYGDSICNINLSKSIKEHFRTKTQYKNVVLTSIMQKSKSTNKIHVTNAQTNELLQTQNSKQNFRINTERINLKKMNVEFRRDIEHCQMYLCTVDVVKSFKETFQYASMYDFIHGMLTSEVYDEKIIGYILGSDELSYRINSAHAYYTAFMHFIANHFYPYSLINRLQGLHASITPTFTYKNFNKIIFNSAYVAKSAIISNNCMIGKQCKIQANAKIEKSIIMEGCKVLANVHLKNCIIMQGVTVQQNYENCLIEIVNENQKITQFLYPINFTNIKSILIDKQIFEQTPECELQKQQTFEEQLNNLVQEDPDLEIMTELISVQKSANKSIAEFTKQIIRIKQPQGVKGVENFVEKWGEVLLKFNQTQANLINSIYYSCLQLPKYQKAFHVFLQYFYGLNIIDSTTIIEWYENQIQKDPDSQVLSKCEAFLEKLREESEEEESDAQNQQQNNSGNNSDQ